MDNMQIAMIVLVALLVLWFFGFLERGIAYVMPSWAGKLPAAPYPMM